MVAHYEIQNIGYLKCFDSSMELKMNVLLTNSCITHEFNLRNPLKIAPYTVSSENISSYIEPKSIASTLEHLRVFYKCFN